MQFTLCMPFFAVLGKFYRNLKGLTCLKSLEELYWDVHIGKSKIMANNYSFSFNLTELHAQALHKHPHTPVALPL